MIPVQSVGCAQSGGEATDEDVVARVRVGEASLYEVLVKRHNSRIRAVVRRVLSNEADVEEVMQETHYKAFRALNQFAGRCSFETWLSHIARNEALRRLQRGTHDLRNRCDDDELIDSAHSRECDPEQQLQVKERLESLQLELSRLPERYRTILWLRGLQELSTAEVAAKLSISGSCVKDRWHRAKGLLGLRLSVS